MTSSLNRQAESGFPARPVEFATEGLSFSESLRVARPESDRVTLSERINPASDALLLNLVDKLPRSLAQMTWNAVKRWVVRGDATPVTLKSGQPGDFRVGRQAPLSLDALMDSLEAGMQQSGLQPTIGPEHIWSPEARGFQGLGYWKRLAGAIRGERPFPFPTFARSKLICALGLGATSLVMPTGRERELQTWMLAQKPASIEVHQLFQKAYELNEGDLYATLLCAENVLSEGLYDPQRQQRPLTTRLSYLRSDSSPQGDNFGGWYHLFGSALYSLMRPEWKARLSMKIEDVGSLILEGKDPQEDHINQLGIELGQRLKQVARQGLRPQVRAREYLNLQEFNWDRKSWKPR